MSSCPRQLFHSQYKEHQQNISPVCGTDAPHSAIVLLRISSVPVAIDVKKKKKEFDIPFSGLHLVISIFFSRYLRFNIPFSTHKIGLFSLVFCCFWPLDVAARGPPFAPYLWLLHLRECSYFTTHWTWMQKSDDEPLRIFFFWFFFPYLLFNVCSLSSLSRIPISCILDLCIVSICISHSLLYVPSIVVSMFQRRDCLPICLPDH